MWVDRRNVCCYFCCPWLPRVRRRTGEEGTAEFMDQGARTAEDVVDTPHAQGYVEKKCTRRSWRVARKMDKWDPSSHPKSGSVDDILHRLDGYKEQSDVRIVYSDTEASDIEDLKNKAEISKSSESLILHSSLEYKIPKFKNQLPPKTLSNAKVKHVPHSDADEMNATEEMIGKYFRRPSGDDVVHKTDKSVNKRLSERVPQSELHEGKTKHRRFLTSLVTKDSKVHDGSQKSEKSDKKTSKQRMADHSGTDEAEKQRIKHERMLENQIMKSYIDASKAMRSEEGTPHASKTKEVTKTAKNGKGKGKKKQQQDERETSHEKGSAPQKDKGEMEEGDPKRKRSRMGFFTKILKKGKKGDGYHDASGKADSSNEAATADDGNETPLLSPSYLSETEEHSSEVKVPERSHRVNFGLKLFPGDNDEEFKKKLESRMARIESEMNEIAGSQKTDTVDGKPPTAPRQKVNQSSSLEGSLPKETSIDGDLNAAPPLLPPRLIKLTPPSPPVNDTSKPSDGPFGLLDEISSCIAPNVFSSPRDNLKRVSEATNGEGGTVSPTEMSGHVGNGSNRASIEFPVPSNAFITRVASEENDKISDKICDSSLNMGFDLGSLDGSNSEQRKLNESQEMCIMNEQEGKEASPRGSDSYLQPVLPSKMETFQRQGVDELSLLLNELDRMNSTLLKQEDIGSNRRPVSEEIKRVSTFEEDFLNAFPIRRRRNSDPDYDIPRPHRIPSLQSTKEEGSIDRVSQNTRPENNRSSTRENTDSIVIEATRFFGPGMDFSFDEQKYSCLKDGGDLWGFQCENKYLIAECVASPPPSASDKSDGPTNDSQLLMNVCIEEVTESNVNENYSSEINASQTNVGELHVNEMTGDSLQPQPSNEDGDDCVLRLGNELRGTDDTGTRDVTLRNSNIDRACRKERSREVYEDDLRNQQELNTLMEGISIDCPLPAEDLLNDEAREEKESVSETAAEGDNIKDLQDELVPDEIEGDPGHIHEIFSEILDAGILEEVEEDIISTTPENMPNTTSVEITPPQCDAEPAIEVMETEFHAESEGDPLVIMRPKDSAVDENKSLRLSFATTETLLVEEEVLVATLKTTTTTTTCLPSSGDGSQAVENVEESVEEVTLDVDKLSQDQFDSFQVQSCVQT